MSLVYTTLLSVVPLLAVSLSLLKAVGVHNQVEPLLRHFFEPLGEKGVEFSQRMLGFVENVQVGVLGSLGLALLLYSVVSLVQKIEEAFIYIFLPNTKVKFSAALVGGLAAGPRYSDDQACFYN